MSFRERRSINFLVSQAFPGALFLDDALYRVSSNYRDLGELVDEPEIIGRHRIRQHVYDAICRQWRAHNEATGRNDHVPVDSDAEFVYLRYNRIRVEPGTDIFSCGKCDRLFKWDEAEENKFHCPHDKDEQLAQLAHVFVHGICGEISYIQPSNCRNIINGKKCNEPLRLHLDYSQMVNSYWWCPKCRYERKLEKEPKDGPGWYTKLRRRCDQCSDDDNYVIMHLRPARTICHAQRVDLVDMPNTDFRPLVNEWFGHDVNEEEIIRKLPEYLQIKYKEDPKWRANILESYREQQIGDDLAISIPPTVKEELSNLEGTHGAIIRETNKLTESTRKILNEKYGLTVSLLDNLAIIRATYGYLIGSSNPSEAFLRVFPMAPPRYAVLTQRLPTEALLFELIPAKVLNWLHARDMLNNIDDDKGLREYLVTCDENDDALTEILGLIHTASHTLRRSSERYTGMGRDVVDELLFTRGLAWVLYNNRGSTLGMFRTTFEGRLREWLAGAEYDLSACPFDPICMHEKEAACPGCLHVGERGCTTYWNGHLDRKYMVTLPTSSSPGYWG